MNVERDEQAAEWCMRLAENSLNPAEQQGFDAWLAEPLNRAAFEHAVLVWQGAETAAELPEVIRLRSRALDSFSHVNSRRWARRISRRGRGWAAVAAAAAVILVAGFFFVRNAPRVYETGIGERRVAMLDDGSQLSLDAATRVEVRLAHDRRELRLLAGRAKFNVAKDPLRPFSVAAANNVVVATGTAFSVELLQQQMHVLLYEGRAVVLDRAGSAAQGRELTPGRELIAPLDGSKAIVVPTDISRAQSWESGQLNFVNEPLPSAVERMNRYGREKLLVGDSGIAACVINGVFTAGDTRAFIEGVRSFFPLKVTSRPDGLLLRSDVAGKNSARTAVPAPD